MTRQDSLKAKNSASSCEKVRTITKNCKDKEERDRGEEKYSTACQLNLQIFSFVVLSQKSAKSMASIIQ